MKYSEKVLKHPIFKKYISEIRTLEAKRIYCCHELEHAIDVARLAWIYYLENKITDEKEEMKDLIYTAALLHDIGRVDQYKTGIHHSISGVAPAMQILQDIEAPEDWMKQIMDVVSEHSHGAVSADKKNLEYYITRADHDCRLCFACEARESCKWTEEEKNHTLKS